MFMYTGGTCMDNVQPVELTTGCSSGKPARSDILFLLYSLTLPLEIYEMIFRLATSTAAQLHTICIANRALQSVQKNAATNDAIFFLDAMVSTCNS